MLNILILSVFGTKLSIKAKFLPSERDVKRLFEQAKNIDVERSIFFPSRRGCKFNVKLNITNCNYINFWLMFHCASSPTLL